MTPEQIERWKQVAKGMCFHLWEHKTEARKARLWKEVESFIDELSPYEITSWEDSPHYPCDWFTEFFYEYEYRFNREGEFVASRDHYSRFYNQLSFVCRASIDLVTNTGGLCIGVTVGDMKRVFGGSLPEWFTSQYEGLANESDGELSIVL